MTKHLSFGAHARRRQVFFCFGKVWRELAWNTVHKSQALHHSAVVLLIVKAFLWVILGTAYFARQGGPGDFPVLRAVLSSLMWIDALGYIFLAWGIAKRSRMVFFIAFPFLIVNAILAVTDQFGLLDLMVLLLDLLILALLVLTKKAFTPKQYADVASHARRPTTPRGFTANFIGRVGQRLHFAFGFGRGRCAMAFPEPLFPRNGRSSRELGVEGKRQ